MMAKIVIVLKKFWQFAWCSKYCFQCLINVSDSGWDLSLNMTTTINASPEIMNKSENGASIQYLPCSIDFTGTSDIEERFSKFTEKDDDTEILSNSIRGFPLQGKILSVPENYKGNLSLSIISFMF